MNTATLKQCLTRQKGYARMRFIPSSYNHFDVIFSRLSTRNASSQAKGIFRGGPKNGPNMGFSGEISKNNILV